MVVEFVRIQVEKYSYIHDDYITETHHEYFSPADATYYAKLVPLSDWPVLPCKTFLMYVKNSTFEVCIGDNLPRSTGCCTWPTANKQWLALGGKSEPCPSIADRHSTQPSSPTS